MNAGANNLSGAVLLPNRRAVPASRPVCTSRHPYRVRCSLHRRARKVQHDRHRPVGWPQLILQQRLQATSGSQSAVVSTDESIESVIADVLNANRTKIQRPVDLLDLLDSTGNGLKTRVNRSWDTTAVNLSLSGTWKGGAQARKMAMLAVYQERHVRRAALLLQLFRYLNNSRPGLLDSNTVTQLEAAAAAAANPLNPAIEVLLVPQLMQISAGVYPWGVLQRVVEGAVQEARNSLFQKPPYTYSSSRRQAAQQQLLYVEASLSRGAAYARLRALLLQNGQQQQHWQQQQGDGARKLTLEEAYYESWQQQQQQGLELQTAADSPSAAAAGGGMQGKCMYSSFHSRSANAPYALQLSPGNTAAAAAGSSLAAAAVGGAESGEIQMLCVVISKLTNEARQLQQGLPGGRESTLGVLPEVQRCLRSALLDLCITWAESSPAVVMDPLPAAAVAKVAVSSIEHDRLLRRIGLESSGPEVTVLRQLARSKGRGFLAHFSPTVGNPFGNITEWDYFRECPGVWNRFVVDPPTDTATLLLKPGKSWQQQQQLSSSGSAAAAAAAARSTEVQLSQIELQQLVQQLVAVLSNNGSSSSRSNIGGNLISQHSAAAAAQSGSRKITLQLAAAAGSSSSSPGSDQAGPRLLLLIDGVTAAELSSAHVTSLVTVIDDLVVQLPGQYGTTLPDVQVSHAKHLKQLAAAAAAWISISSSALAAAALLALPLLAIVRPFRGLQHVAPTSTAAAVVKDVSAAAGSSSSMATQQQQQRLLPMNDHIINAEMQQLCEIVRQQVQGNVWLPDPRSSSSSSKSWHIPRFPAVPRTAAAAATADTATAAAMDDLLYQVTVDREGRVLGCKPCSSAAAAAYLELPLAAAIQGASLAKVQAKRLVTILTADADSPKPAKKAPKPSSSKVSHLAAAYKPLPEDGVVVLKLELKPARQPAAAAASAVKQISDDLQQQQQEDTSDHAAVQNPRSDQGSHLGARSRSGSEVVSKVVGTGRSAVRFILMQPEVSPWRDEDSLRAWADTGSVLYQGSALKAVSNINGARSDLGVPGQGLRASESKLAGLALTVDGQKIESIEALVKQLMEKNNAAEEAAVAAAADLAGKGQ